SIKISPLLMFSRPATMRIVDVLPQPEGPSSATNSASLNASETPCTAVTRPYCLATLSSVRLAMASGASVRWGAQTPSLGVEELLFAPVGREPDRLSD